MIRSRRAALFFFAFCILTLVAGSFPVASAQELAQHRVLPGDTWTALARRYDIPEEQLRIANPHLNRLRQPVIGDDLRIPVPEGTTLVSRNGSLARPGGGGLLATAARTGSNPWSLALSNSIKHPYRPPFYRPIFIPGGAEPPRDLPAGFSNLELSQVPAVPGQALGFRARTQGTAITVTATLANLPLNSFVNGTHVVGLGGTGAFFGRGTPELSIRVNGGPLWSQPWRFVDDVWDYDQVTLTGEAAAIDQEAIAAERARLFLIWNQASPVPQWTGSFQLPIENYLHTSSTYGARRSYNGGPYLTYHEGVDFSAYRGTPVYAPASGTVVLAEQLYVRGGAVIIDHGLGVYSGYYHMSAVHAQPGQVVQAGDLLGEVGTTGLSSGNHLHWDFLVSGTWVDATAWQETGMACWILEAWGSSCQ